MNLEALDAAIDAIEQPEYLLVGQWWIDFWRADKRKRGRLIRKRRTEIQIKGADVETDFRFLVYVENNKLRLAEGYSLKDKLNGETK